MPQRPRAALEVLGPGMRVLGPHGVRPQDGFVPCASFGFHFLYQSSYRVLPLLLLQSSPTRQGRHLQLHRLGPLLGEAPPRSCHVLTPPLAPALRPVEPREQSPRRPQPLRQTRESRPLGASLHQPLFHSMGQHVAQSSHQRRVVQHRLRRVTPLPEAATPVGLWGLPWQPHDARRNAHTRPHRRPEAEQSQSSRGSGWHALSNGSFALYASFRSAAWFPAWNSGNMLRRSRMTGRASPAPARSLEASSFSAFSSSPPTLAPRSRACRRSSASFARTSR